VAGGPPQGLLARLSNTLTERSWPGARPAGGMTSEGFELVPVLSCEFSAMLDGVLVCKSLLRTARGIRLSTVSSVSLHPIPSVAHQVELRNEASEGIVRSSEIVRSSDELT
jgi:hypothetical protein